MALDIAERFKWHAQKCGWPPGLQPALETTPFPFGSTRSSATPLPKSHLQTSHFTAQSEGGERLFLHRHSGHMRFICGVLQKSARQTSFPVTPRVRSRQAVRDRSTAPRKDARARQRGETQLNAARVQLHAAWQQIQARFLQGAEEHPNPIRSLGRRPGNLDASPHTSRSSSSIRQSGIRGVCLLKRARTAVQLMRTSRDPDTMGIRQLGAEALEYLARLHADAQNAASERSRKPRTWTQFNKAIEERKSASV